MTQLQKDVGQSMAKPLTGTASRANAEEQAVPLSQPARR